MHFHIAGKIIIIGVKDGLVVVGLGAAEVVDQDIDAALVGHHGVDHVQNAVLIIGFEVHGLDVQTLGTEGGGLLVAHFQVAAGHIHSGAGLGQRLNTGVTDASGGGGDNCDFSVQHFVYFLSQILYYSCFSY